MIQDMMNKKHILNLVSWSEKIYKIKKYREKNEVIYNCMDTKYHWGDSFHVVVSVNTIELVVNTILSYQ